MRNPVIAAPVSRVLYVGREKVMIVFAEPPSAPESVTLAPQQTRITVSWSPPAESGGRTDLYYQVEHSDPNNLGSFTGTVYLNGGSRSTTFSSLSPFTPYCVRVTAHNGVSDQDPDGTHLRSNTTCGKTKEKGISSILTTVVTLGDQTRGLLSVFFQSLVRYRTWSVSTRQCCGRSH